MSRFVVYVLSPPPTTNFSSTMILFFYLLLFRFSLLIFREKGREGQREVEKHQCVVASRTPPTGDLACNTGMCPDWESNLRLFGLQACAQSSELQQPGV